MSGITPILDTLLHDVLGKRLDLPAPRALNEAVRPVEPGAPPPILRSDSRLDLRPPVAGPAGVSGREATRLPTGLAQLPSGDAPEPPPLSTRANLSPVARMIADILARFPAPPSVIRAPAPLLSAAEATPATVTASLQAAVSDSGLFYESHLARWFRDELPLSQLAREPQMRLSGRAPLEAAASARAPASEPAVGPLTRAPAAEAALPPRPVQGELPVLAATAARAPLNEAGGVPRAPSGEGPMPLSAPAAEPLATARPSVGEAATAGRAAGENASPSATQPLPLRELESSEPLQAIVRHQLELLANPVVRWEGDVWSGIFLALVIHLPGHAEHEAGGETGGEEEADEQDGWHSELRLEIGSLGSLHARLAMREESLGLHLKAGSPELLERLRSGGEDLLQRLRDCGFAEPRLTMSLIEQTDERRD